MRWLCLALLTGCAHAPKLPPKPWPDPMPVARPCIDGGEIERGYLELLQPIEKIRLVDSEGDEHQALRFIVTPKSAIAHADYMERLEKDRERARTGCVAK